MIMLRGGWRLLLILFLAVSLMGCSKVKFAYNQLDWLIPYYTKDYLELSNSQSAYLDQAVNDLLYWHCGNHLNTYAELLREANRDFQGLSMDEQKLKRMVADIEAYWKEIKKQAAPAISELFASSSQAQIDELFSRLQEQNEEWLEDFNAMTEEDLRRKNAEGISDELERWFGPLHPGQQEAVTSWSRQFEPLGMMGLKARQQWQKALQELLESRADSTVLDVGVEQLFVHPERLYSSGYLKRLEANRLLTIGMVEEVSRQLDEKQRRHLDKMIHAIADDLDELACRGEPKPQVRASTGSGFLMDGY
jgi:hypothetical protein